MSGGSSETEEKELRRHADELVAAARSSSRRRRVANCSQRTAEAALVVLRIALLGEMRSAWLFHRLPAHSRPSLPAPKPSSLAQPGLAQQRQHLVDEIRQFVLEVDEGHRRPGEARLAHAHHLVGDWPACRSADRSRRRRQSACGAADRRPRHGSRRISASAPYSDRRAHVSAIVTA